MRTIGLHTRLTQAQARESGEVNAAFRALRGSQQGSPQWLAVNTMQPRMTMAGIGLPWDGFIAARRETLAETRALLARL